MAAHAYWWVACGEPTRPLALAQNSSSFWKKPIPCRVEHKLRLRLTAVGGKQASFSEVLPLGARPTLVGARAGTLVNGVVITKNVDQSTCSASHPEPEDNSVRPSAINEVRSAYWVALIPGRQSDDRYATKADAARPPVNPSAVTATDNIRRS